MYWEFSSEGRETASKGIPPPNYCEIRKRVKSFISPEFKDYKTV